MRITYKEESLKIDICFITSTPHLSSHASLGHRQLCLAHKVLDDKEYAHYYSRMTKSVFSLSMKEKYVIMDNSAFEFEQQGRGVPIDKVLQAAKIVTPSELCAIDILFDGPGTVESVQRFLTYVDDKDPYMFNSTKMMAIPQGKNETEWLDCYEELVQMEGVDVIGFSKLSIPESFVGDHHTDGNCTRGRIKCLDFLVDHNMTPDVFGKETHLLGSDNLGLQELSYYYEKNYDFIRSNDTSMPFVYGYNGIKIKDNKVNHILMDKLDFNKQLTSDEMEAVDYNFLAWRTLNVK